MQYNINRCARKLICINSNILKDIQTLATTAGVFYFKMKIGNEMKTLCRLFNQFIQLIGLAKDSATPPYNKYDDFLGPESYKQVY